MKGKQTIYNLIIYFKSLAVKLETTYKSAKPPTNHPNHPQTIHRPATNQPNHQQITQITHKPPKSSTNQSQTSQTTHKAAITTYF